MALAGFVLVLAAGYEYFFWTGLLLGLFYVLALLYATWTAGRDGELNCGTERRRSVSLAFSVFLLLFILIHGATSRTGVILELYEPEAVDQYAWPPGRVALLAPVAAVLVVATLVSVKRMLQPAAAPARPGAKVSYLPERMADLITFIGIVGAVSIWPGKIAVLYAVFLCVAIFALNRLNHRFDEIDALGFTRSASNSSPPGTRSPTYSCKQGKRDSYSP
jgi:succinate dehydrogenase hydrophobic anchor subunit